MTILLVDWLGRGGIAQVTEAWAIELAAGGLKTVVVTRPGRELGQGTVAVHPVAARRNRFLAHAGLVRATIEVIHEQRPETVVLQNHLIPPLEAAVDRAARQAGSRVVRVVHDHRLHTWRAGTQLGLGKLLRRADLVLAHSHYVGDRVAAQIGRAVEVLPLPIQVGVLAHERGLVAPDLVGAGPLALHFGVVRREYKGAETIIGLAAAGVNGWRIGVVGIGAPVGPGLATVAGYVAPGVLAAAVNASAACLLPYRFATQSGAIVLAQALGSVPIATAVGGLVEQIEDGRTGLLLPPDAPLSAWRQALERLSDEPERRTLAAEAAVHAWEQHRRFSQRIQAIVAGA